MSQHDHAPVDLAQIAKDTAEKMTAVARLVYPVEQKPIRILECFLCQGFGRDEDGSKCFNCAGLGRIATDGGEV